MKKLFRDMAEDRKQYRVVGLVMFGIALGLVAMRILVYFLPIRSDTVLDLVFTLPVQLGVLVVFPFCMYRFVLKKSTREVLAFSSFKRTKWYNLALSVPLGICVFFATIGISSVWYAIIVKLGYNMPSSPTDFPDKFNVGLLLLSVFLTGVLPGFCEEFANRGGFITTMRSSFAPVTVILIGALEFGLFHQNIKQVFYTACFGALMVFLVMKTKSVFPAMIVHFMNNTLSVYTDYAGAYNLPGGSLFDLINRMAYAQPLLMVACYLVVCAVGAGIVILMVRLADVRRTDKKLALVKDAGFDHTHNRVVLLGEENKQLVEEVGLVGEVYGEAYVPDEKFKPTLRDNAFYIGAIVLASLTTIFSFVWGLFY